jgi:hypothetical protein
MQTHCQDSIQMFLSAGSGKKALICVARICFHERRLQYMEAEQIQAWSQNRPNERILEVDMPLVSHRQVNLICSVCSNDFTHSLCQTIS